MRIKSILILFVAFLFAGKTYAQYAQFPQSGTIYYDKTVYLKNIILKRFLPLSDDWSKRFYEDNRNKFQESVTLKRVIKFNQNTYSFTNEKTDLDAFSQQILSSHTLDGNVLNYIDLDKKSIKKLAEVGGENIYIVDSLMDITWKITNEYRTIAGYECRRANGLSADSVYLVAYFTNNIPTAGGPESVYGLPGMILGLAIPSMHVQYFATKVEISNLEVSDNVLGKKKVKEQTRKQVEEQIRSTLAQYMKKDILDYIFKLFNL